MVRTILKRYEFWLFLIIGFVLLFVFFNTAKASEIIGQQNDYSILSNRQTSHPNQLYVFKFNAADRASFATWEYGEPIIFSTIIDTDFTYCSYGFRDIDDNNITAFGENNVGCWGLGEGISRTSTDLGGNRWRWDLTITSENAVYGYLFDKRDVLAGFRMGNMNQGNFKIAGTTASTYGQTGNWGSNESFEGDIDEIIYTGWFKVEGNFAPPIPDFSLEWEFPVTTTSTSDFGFWLLNAKSLADFYLQTHYYNDDYSQEYTDTAGLFLETEGEVKLKAVLKSNALSYGLWNAEAFLISDDFLITYAQTDVINFTIATSTTAIPIIEASTTCSGLGWIGEPMCQLGFLLFIPKQSSFNNFNNLKATLENKPPFGYASAIYEALTGFASATATSTINLSAFATLPIITPIKTTLTIIIWLAFVFGFFNRVKHFEF